MAITVARVRDTGITPTGRCVIADVTFDSGYPAGGEPYTPAMFGLTRIDFMACETAKASSTTGFAAHCDHAASKIMLFGNNITTAGLALVECSVANQSATVVRVMAYELPNI